MYTPNYDEMLANPDKKYLTLGTHPEIDSEDTRIIEPMYEDPIIQLNDEELKQLKEKENKRMDKINEFIKMV